jgi:ubiquitin carboxyl-terminal hydrolase L3
MITSVQWPALESDPEIFTNYAQKMGLKSSHTFNEIFSLDEDMLSMAQGPAVIFCFNYNKNGPKRVLDESKFVETSTIPYYMKQSGTLDLACGIIAMLHCLGNSKVEFEDGSVLQKYFEKAKNLSAEERSACLENCNDFKQAHVQFASQGQSSIPQTSEQCNYHFIAYVNVDGKLYELDGLKKGPYLLKDNLTDTNIVPFVAEEVKKELEDGTITENFALMFLS